jgi:hypothetical protein
MSANLESNALEAKPKRRWFRFSLRTLFVLITACAIFFGWELHWKNQRHEYLKTHKGFNAATRLRAPGLLWLFGELGVNQVVVESPGFGEMSAKRLYNDHAPPEAVAARNLFPEAAIIVVEGETVWEGWQPGTEWKRHDG